MQIRPAERSSLARFAALSIVAAVLTIALKTMAFLLTGSVGLLSDALESIVNLAAAVAALIALVIAARPADDNHQFGHEKVEYFASGFEGALILFAAVGIGAAAIERLVRPQPIEQIGLGLAVAIIASLINLVVALVLLRAGRRYHSVTLDADAKHLLTDVWTSVGVVVGIAAVGVTGWIWLDPVLALLVAANIIWTGWKIIRQSTLGLSDVALPVADLQRIESILDSLRSQGIQWHALRTRQAGARRFAQVHILVPGAWSVRQGHDLLEKVEHDLRTSLPGLTILTHLEPAEDPASWEDIELDRAESRT